jgi:hypothetical protein
MDSEIEFKFNRVYVTVLFLATLITASGFYVIYSDFSNLNIFTILFLCLLPVFIGLTAVPKFLRMVTGKPAIALTNDHLVDNTNGIIIDWNDIWDAKIISTARGPGAIAITLKQPEKYFNTFPKKISYGLSNIFSKNHIVIYFSLIIEKDDSLFWQIKAHLPKH